MQYRVDGGIATISANTPIQMDEKQVARRAHRVRELPLRKGWYVADSILQFKVGETIALDAGFAELPRHLQTVLTPLDATGAATEKPAREKTPAGAPAKAPARKAPARKAPAAKAGA